MDRGSEEPARDAAAAAVQVQRHRRAQLPAQLAGARVPRAARPGDPDAGPSPATHAILTDLKAGESVFQIFLLTKTVFHAYRGAQPLFHALFGVETLSETLFPVFNGNGDGTRPLRALEPQKAAPRDACFLEISILAARWQRARTAATVTPRVDRYRERATFGC